MRIALGVSYNGQAYNGWQSQTNGNTVQDKLEAALAALLLRACPPRVPAAPMPGCMG